MTKSKSTKVVKSAASNLRKEQQSKSSAALAYPSHEWVDMLADPLSAPAAQIPDEWSFPTQAMKLTMTVDLTTDTAGSLALGVGHSLAAYLRSFTITGQNLTPGTILSTSAHTDNTAYIAAFSRSRVTCGGLSYLPTNTPESSQGTIAFLSLPEEQVAGYNGLSLATVASDGVTCEIDEEVSVHVHNYALPMFYTSHSYYEHAPTTLVILRGCKASTVVGQLRMVLNVEGIASASSVHAGASTVEPFDSVAMATGAHIQQSTTNSQVVSTGRQGPRRLTASGRAVADASAALAGMYVGGAAGTLAGSMPQKYRDLRRQLKAALAARKRTY